VATGGLATVFSFHAQARIVHNYTVSPNAPLRYPIGIALDAPVPPTRHHLFEMTGKFSLLVPLNLINVSRSIEQQCQAAAAVLGLPGLPATVTLPERRAQIADHLGVQP